MKSQQREVEDAMDFSKLLRIAGKLRTRGEPVLSGALKHFVNTGQRHNSEFMNWVAFAFLEAYVPPSVVGFSEGLLAKRKPQSVLDPYPGLGLFLSVVAEHTQAHGLGLIQKTPGFKTAELILANAEMGWRVGAPLKLLDKITTKFDAVVSDLSLIAPRLFLQWDDGWSRMEISDDLRRSIMFSSALRLSPTGVGLFIVSTSFFSESTKIWVRQALSVCSFSITACLSIPASDYAGET
jgi:hypothetical protein